MKSAGARIAPIYDEDYVFQWGKTHYKGKTVLDLGADIGSTADFFLRKGAEKVIAVEGSEAQFKRLQANAAVLKGVVPVFLFIEHSSQIEDLMLQYSFDIVKTDIEGGEINLFGIKDEIFSKVPEYLVEVHSDTLYSIMLRKFARNDYKIVSVNACASPTRIVYARKRQKHVRNSLG